MRRSLADGALPPVQLLDFGLLPPVEGFLLLVGFFWRWLTTTDAEGTVLGGSGFIKLAASRTIE
jgi:hypothetical protein